MKRRSAASLTGAIALALLSTTVAVTQEDATAVPTEAPLDDGVIAVEGVEYAFIGLPEAVPVGTELAFDNTGAEFHELAVARIVDDSVELDELIALGQEAFTQGLVEPEEAWALVANPGERAEGTLPLTVPGRYLATCLVPQGMVPTILADLGVTPDMAPADWPPEAQAILENPSHAELGMVQIFEVSP